MKAMITLAGVGALAVALFVVGCQKQSGQYTCPMHPEIVQDGPGKCPKCGMSLEPKK